MASRLAIRGSAPGCANPADHRCQRQGKKRSLAWPAQTVPDAPCRGGRHHRTTDRGGERTQEPRRGASLLDNYNRKKAAASAITMLTAAQKAKVVCLIGEDN